MEKKHIQSIADKIRESSSWDVYTYLEEGIYEEEEDEADLKAQELLDKQVTEEEMEKKFSETVEKFELDESEIERLVSKEEKHFDEKYSGKELLRAKLFYALKEAVFSEIHHH